MSDAPFGPAYVGLMSGTSLDGISAAVVRFRETAGERFDHRLIAFRTIAYTNEQRERLKQLIEASPGVRALTLLNFELGAWFAAAATAAIADAGVERRDVRAIGLHGHTMWHEPPLGTLQLGESAVVAERLGVDVISDFRVRDVAAGGQGAPLVPRTDAMLYSHAEHWRGVQNIGGIGNLTVLPPGGEPTGVRGFDTGPGVMLIDAVVRLLVPALSYDRDGLLAGGGVPAHGIVHEELQDLFFRTVPPKSTGRERFGTSKAQALIARCIAANPSMTTEDIVATATAITAESIADAVRRFVPEPVAELLVAGGGAHNHTLIRMLGLALPEIPIRLFRDVYGDGDAKEAVAFALLAHLHLEHRSGNLPRVTGALGTRVLGKLTPAT